MNLKPYLKTEGELPLDRLVDDGGYTAIFRTIGCIGDSLSSGEFESTNEEKTTKGYHDYYEYSWGQFIARTVGSTVYNFSRGGMTADEYWNQFAEANDFWNPDKLCQAYIIALGVNDLFWQGYQVGSVASDVNLSDYNQNANTFCGYYARIIQRIKEMQPQARFFLMTMPRRSDEERFDQIQQEQAKLLYDLAELFDYTYVLDFYKYAPDYDEDFRKAFYLGGHMNPMGYWLTAKMVMSYIDYIVRQSPEDFAQIGFIGKGVHNYNAKW